MIAVADPTARYALIVGLAVGTGFGCWLQGWLWWLVMYKAWVHGHEARRKRRLRPRRDWRGRWS